MTTTISEKVLDAIAGALHALANRLKPIEEDMADSAAALESLAEGMTEVNRKVDKLSEMAVDHSEGLDSLKAMFQNYLDATKEARLKAERAVLSANQLRSEVREKLKDCADGKR